MITPPIPVMLPLVVAIVLAAWGRRMPQWAPPVLAILTSLVVAGVAVSMIVYSRLEPIVYWVGGWTPRDSGPFTVGFVIDNTGAMLILLASVLAAASLIFSTRYFDRPRPGYYALMLAFLAGADGVSQTADILSLLLFFELMTISAFALCLRNAEAPAAVRPSLNFASANAAGAALALVGIAILYARTGALNLAQIGRALDSGPDALALTALFLIASGFLIKAAVAPFHFWLADAHSAAPAPLAMLFSAAVVNLALYAAVRIYWAAFSGALAPREHELRNILVAAGVLSVAAGAALCWMERDLKRLLAFSAVSHVGVMLLGAALLTPEGLAGTSIYAIGHGMAQGSLVLTAGILLHRKGSAHLAHLAGRGAGMGATGLLLLAGAAALAGSAPFGTFWGNNLLMAAFQRMGYGWAGWLALAAAAVTAGAVLRFAAQVFLPWPKPAEGNVPIPDSHPRTPAALYVPATALIVLSGLVGAAPGLTGAAIAAATHVQSRSEYAQRVIDGLSPHLAVVRDQPALASDFIRGAAVLGAAAALAWISLLFFRNRQPAAAGRWTGVLRAAHGGAVADHLKWIAAGLACLGAASALWLT